MPTSTAIPTPTVSPTPEPPAPELSVSNQILEDDGQLTIDRVVARIAGWVVIHADEEGEVGSVLGYVNVAEGESENITVEIDPFKASPTLYAMLHIDGGQSGSFEFPGPDRPILIESDFVMEPFEVDVQVFVPSVSVSDQELADGDPVVIDQVIAVDPGWVAVHLDDEGNPGSVLGFAPVTKGENNAVIVNINWREATPTLHALLYTDGGEPDRFEDADVDQPVMIGETPVAAPFKAIFPPDVFVLDQSVMDGEVNVERATSYGPGWLVVYHDDEGQLGKIIGWAPLEDGINERIVVQVTESAVTPILHIMLHEDQEAEGEFGFPRTDPQVVYRERLPNPFSFRTDIGNFLFTRDQELSAGNTVTVPLVVVDENTWVVVRAGNMEEPGEIAGMTWVPPGFHRDIAVEVNPELVSNSMLIVLHLDAGSIKEFEYPNGVDIPLQRNRAAIQAPFRLLNDNEDE